MSLIVEKLGGLMLLFGKRPAGNGWRSGLLVVLLPCASTGLQKQQWHGVHTDQSAMSLLSAAA